MKLSERIRLKVIETREKSGLSISEWHKKLEISRQQAWNIENGRGSASIGLLERIESMFSVVF